MLLFYQGGNKQAAWTNPNEKTEILQTHMVIN